MNKIFTNSLVTLLLASMPGLAAQTDDEAMQRQVLQDSRQIAQAFMQTLGATLKGQLASSSAENAISVCKYVAPALAADYSKGGRIVTRVSLKNRNKTLGSPDVWEREVLEKFDQEKAGAEAVGLMETSAVVEEQDGRWFRYMKAIPTQAMCLQCHGQADDMSEEVKAILAKEYPEDSAIGYRVGDIRGAISIKQKLTIQP